MMDSYIITIDEMDDAEVAIAEFKEKLAGVTLLKNSFGVISAHPDAICSGVVTAVCKTLPFPTAGMGCNAVGANGKFGMCLFSMMIFTSDTCDFVCGKVDGLNNIDDDDDESGYAERVRARYLELKEKAGGNISMTLMYTPLSIVHFPGEYISAISKIDPAVPIFGGVAHAKSTFSMEDKPFTLCDGEALEEAVVLVLVSGDFKPQFYVSSINDEAIMLPDVGHVTKAEKNVMYEINNTNALEFLRQIGYYKGDVMFTHSDAGLMSTTFVLDSGEKCELECHKNCPISARNISRAPLMFDEEGLVCMGHIPENAALSIAVVTPDSVRATTYDLVRKILDSGAKSALIYSCAGRVIGLFDKPMAELEILKDELSGRVNYIAGYTSGEICPTCVTPLHARNNEHNQTLIVCAF